VKAEIGWLGLGWTGERGLLRVEPSSRHDRLNKGVAPANVQYRCLVEHGIARCVYAVRLVLCANTGRLFEKL